jgi:capping protein beta
VCFKQKVIVRSPWSNTYDPPLEDESYAPAMPSEKLRKLEVDANAAFEQYREMYFEGGVSSVYLWDLEHGFAGNFKRFNWKKII